jgi:hypothetical protein
MKHRERGSDRRDVARRVGPSGERWLAQHNSEVTVHDGSL